MRGCKILLVEDVWLACTKLFDTLLMCEDNKLRSGCDYCVLVSEEEISFCSFYF